MKLRWPRGRYNGSRIGGIEAKASMGKEVAKAKEIVRDLAARIIEEVDSLVDLDAQGDYNTSESERILGDRCAKLKHEANEWADWLQVIWVNTTTVSAFMVYL